MPKKKKKRPASSSQQELDVLYRALENRDGLVQQKASRLERSARTNVTVQETLDYFSSRKINQALKRKIRRLRRKTKTKSPDHAGVYGAQLRSKPKTNIITGPDDE